MTSCIGGENSEDEESLNQLLFSVLTKMSLRQLSLSDLYVLALLHPPEGLGRDPSRYCALIG